MAKKKNIGQEEIRIVSENTDEVLARVRDRGRERMENAISSLEEKMTNQLRKIEVNQNGRIEGLKVNLKQTQSIHKSMINEFEKTYGVQARRLVSDFDTVSDLVENSWTYLGESANYTKVDQDMISALKESSFEQFQEFGRQAQQNITDAMYSHVAGGGSFASLLNTVRGTLTGHYAANGRPMVQYARQFAFDSVMNFHNQVNLSKANDLGIYHFLYVGDIMGTSRKFCRRRAGKVYTRGQINSWNRYQWAGKAGPAFQYRGGYNCRHHWRPVRPEWLDGKTQLDIGDWNVGDVYAKPKGLKQITGTRGWNDFTKDERKLISNLQRRTKAGVKLTEGQKGVKFWKNGLNQAEREMFIEAFEKEGIEVPDILKTGGKNITPPVKPTVKPVKPTKPKTKPVTPPKTVKPKERPALPAGARPWEQLTPEENKLATGLRRTVIKNPDKIKSGIPRVKKWEKLPSADREMIVARWEAEGLDVPDVLKVKATTGPPVKVIPSEPKPEPPITRPKRETFVPEGATLDRELFDMDFKFGKKNTIRIYNEDFEDVGSVRFYTITESDGTRDIFIDMIQVNHSVLGKGYGTALIDDLVDLADDYGVKTISGESISPSLEKILKKKFGDPIYVDDWDAWRTGAPGVDVTYSIVPKKQIPKNWESLDKQRTDLRKKLGPASWREEQEIREELKIIETELEKTAPHNIVKKMREDLIEEMSIISSGVNKKIAIKNVYEGTQHMSFSALRELRESGLRVEIDTIGSTRFSASSRMVYCYKHSKFSNAIMYDPKSVAHEFAHAIDSRMASGSSQNLDPILGAWKDGNPFGTTKEDSNAYRRWFLKQTTGKRAIAYNGNQSYEYYVGNFIDSYEARIYANGQLNPEFWSMGVERYVHALQEASKTVKKVSKQLTFHDMQVILEMHKDSPLSQVVLNDFKDQVYTARLLTKEMSGEEYFELFLNNNPYHDFKKQQQMYPEFAEFIKKFFRDMRKDRPLEIADFFDNAISSERMQELKKIASIDIQELQ